MGTDFPPHFLVFRGADMFVGSLVPRLFIGETAYLMNGEATHGHGLPSSLLALRGADMFVLAYN